MAKILIRQRMKDFKLNAVAEFVNEWHEDTLTYTSSDYLLTDTVEEIADALLDQYHVMQPDSRSGSREVSKKDRYEVRKHIVLKIVRVKVRRCAVAHPRCLQAEAGLAWGRAGVGARWG